MITLGPLHAHADFDRHVSAWAGCWGVGGVDLFVTRRTFQFVVRLRSLQFHVSTASGVYVWPTKRHHTPRWGYVRSAR